MLIAVADAAFHDVPAAVLWILSSSVTFSGSVCAVSFSFAFKETLDVILCVEESTSGKGTTLASSFSFALSFSAEALLEEAAESPDWLTVEASPGFPGHPMPEEDSFGSFGFGHDGSVWGEFCRKRLIAII